MNSKLQLAVFCGGQSAEHEISIVSAKNVLKALNSEKYHIHIIFIAKNGGWFLFNSIENFLNSPQPDLLLETEHCQKVSLVFGETHALMTLDKNPKTINLDVAFPVLHGSHGEDGTIQGLLELANIPFVGAGVLSSAICMDKEVSKQLLRAAGISIVDWLGIDHRNVEQIDFATVVKQLGSPVFVKPANTGSSVGVSKVDNTQDFRNAVKLALQYDKRILVERYIEGREIECAVLGNETPEASLPAEIVIHHEFYSYEAKYLDPNGATLVVPAKLSPALTAEIQTLAKKAFIALGCEGMARVDFFIAKDEKIWVNELNTIPGFTQISMYPKMWQVSGLSYPDLLDKLIALALERFARNRVLVNSRRMQNETQAL